MTVVPASLDLSRFAIKLFASSAPADALVKTVPVFHRWIQKHQVPGILVDVADYGHLPQSPGVVLVGHEANLSLDATEGPLGLLYTRKTPLAGGPSARIRAALGILLDAAATLEIEPEFQGKLQFRTNELWFLSNDRLALPNSDEAFGLVRPVLEEVVRPSFGGKVDIVRDAADPRRRLTLRITSLTATPLDQLAEQFKASS